ncbi:LytR family transcriptional regulator [Canna indica]|uniref:LytR family transcriptional regulator n=1 Tax=Canna indica TaxID=4628 RepID=A0AAQ3L2X8_9LILI|nr:LytR family transcriptional regulator [Canna indica]
MLFPCPRAQQVRPPFPLLLECSAGPPLLPGSAPLPEAPPSRRFYLTLFFFFFFPALSQRPVIRLPGLPARVLRRFSPFFPALSKRRASSRRAPSGGGQRPSSGRAPSGSGQRPSFRRAPSGSGQRPSSRRAPSVS